MEYKELEPRRLVPPTEVRKEIINKEKSQLPKNIILRFFKIFFGEGF